MAPFNTPQMNNAGNDVNAGKIKRYVHQAITINHYGINASIQTNGKIRITANPTRIAGTDEMEYDEVEIPASLVFKLAGLLKATREIKYVTLQELANEPGETQE